MARISCSRQRCVSSRAVEPTFVIISHAHRYIFLKTNKTAGTSFEIALCKYCGAEDVITPISRDDESMRASLGHRGPQHYLAPLSDYDLRDHFRRLVLRKPKRRYYNHITATEVRGFVGPDIWNGYFKFCFERHPYDRVLSLYYWRHRTEPRPPVSEFIRSGAPELLRRRGWDLYTIAGQVAVDRVCLYENMAAELDFVRAQFGFAEPLALPRAKGAHRDRQRTTDEMLSAADKGAIRDLFRIEFERYGFAP
jgi:sulfotransferase famil protein